jgi:hypothetical protein
MKLYSVVPLGKPMCFLSHAPTASNWLEKFACCHFCYSLCKFRCSLYKIASAECFCSSRESTVGFRFWGIDDVKGYHPLKTECIAVVTPHTSQNDGRVTETVMKKPWLFHLKANNAQLQLMDVTDF